MKALVLSIASGMLAVGLVAWQTALPQVLTDSYDKLAKAPTLTVTYTEQEIGGAKTEYKLALSKPNLFKLSNADGFVESDGKMLYSYKKEKNTYTQVPLTDDVVAAFAKRHEVYGWASFLLKKPDSDILAAKLGTAKIVKGHDVQPVDLVFKTPNLTATLSIDSKLGIPRAYDYKKGQKDYLVIASDIVVGENPAPADQFAFNPPQGSTKVDPDEVESSFADVLTLMQNNCLPCHGAARRSAGFELDNYQGIAASVTPGMAAGSMLIKALRGDGVDLMPRGRAPLTEAQIKSVEKWINDGAKNG
jgi:outer membrane lipoprotein-sorting protein